MAQIINPAIFGGVPFIECCVGSAIYNAANQVFICDGNLNVIASRQSPVYPNTIKSQCFEEYENTNGSFVLRTNCNGHFIGYDQSGVKFDDDYEVGSTLHTGAASNSFLISFCTKKYD